jgi:beta-lactamase superfamily II metal-dependent hydrolase
MENNKGFEIDFLPVGEGTDGGDAIILRYGNLLGKRNEQDIIVIDGGYKQSGDTIVDHIKTYYKVQNLETNYIDLVILTHPDSDHASGLTKIFENFKVLNLLMHRPWTYSTLLKDAFVDGRLTSYSLRERIKKNLESVYEVEKLASKQKDPICNIVEPFSGIQYDSGILQVLAPNKEFYISLIPQFEKTPEEKKQFQYLAKSAGVQEVKKSEYETENWDNEKLNDPETDATSAENISSAIILFNYEGKKVLFTGDAGIITFDDALSYSRKNNIDLSDLFLIKIPHHGSKHNLSKRILNILLGYPQKQLNYVNKGYAIASVAKNSDIKHPSRKITNAFYRRGYKTYQTKGEKINWSFNVPSRNWDKAIPIEFYTNVDAD